MAFTQPHSLDASAATDHVATRPKPGLFARLLAAIMESRQRQADREIARFVELNGGRLTDGLEFRIEQRLLHGRDPGRGL